MAKTALNPILKLVLEIGPVIAFFVVFRYAGGDTPEMQFEGMMTATAVFVPLSIATLAISWFLTGTLPRMALVTAIVVLVFGGLTLWLRDDTFIKMKPTVIYGLFAAILGFGLMRGQSYLQYLMGEMMPLSHTGWMTFTKRFALFFVTMAMVNEAVWRTQDTDTWVTFKTFVLTGALLVFIMSQMPLLQRHAIEDTDKSGTGDG